MTMSKSKLVQRMLADVGIGRITLAAVYVMKQGVPENQVFSPTEEEIKDWIASLDAKRLRLIWGMAKTIGEPGIASPEEVEMLEMLEKAGKHH